MTEIEPATQYVEGSTVPGKMGVYALAHPRNTADGMIEVKRAGVARIGYLRPSGADAYPNTEAGAMPLQYT
jgi:hypothetical protein